MFLGVKEKRDSLAPRPFFHALIHGILLIKNPDDDMKSSDYLIWIGTAALAGGALGLIAGGKNSAKNGLLGAMAGVIAGSVAAGVYEYATREEIPYYSSLSPLYDEAEVA